MTLRTGRRNPSLGGPILTERRRSVVRTGRAALFAAAVGFQAAPACAYDMSMHTALSQLGSPVQLQSCYLGTNFSFGDPNFAAEETKMQLSASLSKPVASQYRLIGLRFEFGLDGGARSSDVIVFTGSQPSGDRGIMAVPNGLNPSAYLTRVEDYDDYGCGVDFATPLDWTGAWFDTSSDVVACKSSTPVIESGSVYLSALELRPASADAVFLMNDKGQKGLYWSLDGSAPQYAEADGFGRATVTLGQLAQTAHALAFGPASGKLDQQMCFRPFLATR